MKIKRLKGPTATSSHKKIEAKVVNENKSKGRTRNDNRWLYDSRKWKDRVRPSKINRDPLCEICLERDEFKDATEVDHIKPVSAGGAPYDMDNLQSLCSSCHSRKSAKERHMKTEKNGREFKQW